MNPQISLRRFLYLFRSTTTAQSRCAPQVDLIPTCIVNQHIDNKSSLREFTRDIEDNKISNTQTAILLSKIKEYELDNLLETSKKYMGIYEIGLNPNNKEEYKIYFAFPNPYNAFKYLNEIEFKSTKLL